MHNLQSNFDNGMLPDVDIINPGLILVYYLDKR
jgi:hypothetical protein